IRERSIESALTLVTRPVEQGPASGSTDRDTRARENLERRSGLDLVAVFRFLVLGVHPALELSHAPTHVPHQTRKLGASEQQQHDEGDEQQLPVANAEHGQTPAVPKHNET